MDRKTALIHAAEKYDSFYLYDESVILNQVETLKAAFPDAALLYSVKCNPDPRVLKRVFGSGLWADAASAREVELAREAGLTPEQIYYSAPGKTTQDLERTVDHATIIADSPEEVRRLAALAEKLGRTLAIGLRVNPDFSFTGGSGTPSKFGIDEDQIPAVVAEAGKALRINGIHVHLRSQELEAEVLSHYHQNLLALADRLQAQCGIALDYINMGSGIGIPYAENDHPLDVQAVGQAMDAAVRAFRERYPNTKIFLETGRYAVGQSGTYVTRVLDRKVSHGKTYLIVKNTLNGFIRPSLARLVAHYGGDGAAASEPLFTKTNAFTFSAFEKDDPTEEVTVVGNLCTAADVIAENIQLPHLDCGDLLTISNAGAYAAVLTPMQFSSQDRSPELFLDLNGNLI